MERREVLLVVATLVVAVLADTSLRRQVRLEESAALERALADTTAAVWTVHSALVRLEGEAISGPDVVAKGGIVVWRQAVPRERSLEGPSGTAFRKRSEEDLRRLADSDRVTRSGLPVAVLAALALDDEAVLDAVRARFLLGELPVAPADAEGLAEILEIPPGPELERLFERLARLPPHPPAYPDFVRTIVDGHVSGFSRLERDVVHYEVSLDELFSRAGTVGSAVLDPEGEAIPGLEVVHIRVRPEARGTQRLQLARFLMATIFAVGLFALLRILRGAVREREAAQRERTLLAAVSHDLRTPLASVRLFGESLVEGIGEPKEYGRLIADEAQRLEETFERILSATRTREAPRFEAVDPATLISRAREGAMGLAARHDVEIEIEVEDVETLPEARWDGNGITLALGNLLDNAIRHGGSGGKVRLSARIEGRRVRFSVRDRGRGIRPAERSRVFEKFARAADAQGGGVGLGLYLVEGTAKAHGGRVEIETPPEGGCVVHLLLPIGEQP